MAMLASDGRHNALESFPLIVIQLRHAVFSFHEFGVTIIVQLFYDMRILYLGFPVSLMAGHAVNVSQRVASLIHDLL